MRRASVLANDAVNRSSLRRSSAFTRSRVPLPHGSVTRVGSRGLLLFVVGAWEERAGRNEALFREVNENIAKLEERLDATGSDSLPVICECARADCTTQFEISLDEYARVRQHPDRFIIARGHEDSSIEHVVETHSEYVVVEKEGAAEVAADAAS